MGDSPFRNPYNRALSWDSGVRKAWPGAKVEKLIAHRCGSFLHCFLGIFHLEKVSIWGEDSDCPVIPRCHGTGLRQFLPCQRRYCQTNEGEVSWLLPRATRKCLPRALNASRKCSRAARGDAPWQRRRPRPDAAQKSLFRLPVQGCLVRWRSSSATVSAWCTLPSFPTTVLP